MRNIDFIDIFRGFSSNLAIVWKGFICSYEELIDLITENSLLLKSSKIKIGSVVSIEGDFSPKSISLLFALIAHKCIIVPINRNGNSTIEDLYKIAQVQYIFRINNKEEVKIEMMKKSSNNKYYNSINARGNPGLVLFSSGTSGVPKAAVHDFSALLKKFKNRKSSLRTLNFLLFDHWGGLNTMFHILSNGGTLISVNDRTPLGVCELIQTHAIELLPVTPTFLNLLLISRAYEKYNLTSLKIISYGTEPMPDTTLKKLNEIFPNVRLLQTYGLIELGVMSSKSKNNKSLWVKVGGEGYKTRIVKDILQIKADSAMLGYLNAPSPFTDDGWFITGDKVLKDGDYIKILGRESEIINVGGEKVYPQEIENVILELRNVADVTVYGEANSITGNIVCAKIQLKEQEDKKNAVNTIKKYCRGKLQPYKVPVKIIIDDALHFGERFKKERNNNKD